MAASVARGNTAPQTSDCLSVLCGVFSAISAVKAPNVLTSFKAFLCAFYGERCCVMPKYPRIQGAAMKSFLPILAVSLAISAIALTHSSSAAPTKATPETLKQLEAEFMKSAADKGSQGYMSYYADDAVEVPNGHAAIQGKAE